MALDPELLKRRKRTMLPRAPLRPLQEQVKGLKTADEELKALLEQLLDEAKLTTMFTVTLERDRLFSALYYAGFVFPVWINVETQLAPLTAATLYLAVPPGIVLVGKDAASYNSLPWHLSLAVWMDTELPALPLIAVARHPDVYRLVFGGIVPTRRFIRYDLFNLHAVNTLNWGIFQTFAYMTNTVWQMLEAIYLKPIAEYAQEKAEELTGRPFP